MLAPCVLAMLDSRSPNHDATRPREHRRLASSPPRWIVAGPTLLAAVGAIACLIWAPPSQDLAAASFRADLFADHGFLLWTNQWYSGHYLLSYSVLYPPLGALLGPRLVGALAVVAAAAIFALLARRRFGAAALIPSLWFAAAIACWLLTGRIPFLLAVPLGLAALLPKPPGPLWPAGIAAVLTSLASPVAGLFLALTGVAIGSAAERRRGLVLALGAGIPIVVLNVLFPIGGHEPFVFSAFIAIPLLAAVVVWLVPIRFRALRIGAVLYAALALAILIVPTALGGNVTRLGALFAGPVLALVLWPRGRFVVIAVSIPLLYWQLVAPIRDVRKASGDGATERSFYEPLLGELRSLQAGAPPFRVEVPPTKNRWEADYVAREFPIARGWLRQLESVDFDLFSDGSLDAASYRDWLDRHAVSYVAMPDAPLDYLAEDEVALITNGLDYLDPVWHDDDWSLYSVDDPRGLGVSAAGADWFEVEAPLPGEYPVAINFTSTWTVDGGDACVERAGDGSTVVVAREPGTVRVSSRLGFGSGC
jgi:hypothetical protein